MSPVIAGPVYHSFHVEAPSVAIERCCKPSWTEADMEADGYDLLVDYHTQNQIDAENALMDDQNQLQDDTERAQAVAELPPLRGLDFVDFVDKVISHTSGSNPTKKLREKALALDAEEMPKLTTKRYKQIVKLLMRSHGMDKDPKIDMEKAKQTLTYVDDLVDKEMMSDYVKRQQNSDSAIKFAEKHPGQLDDIAKESARAYAMEMFMSSLQPEQHENLNELCDRFNLSHYPDIRLPCQDESRPIHQAPRFWIPPDLLAAILSFST
ncbi:hypothetical protein IL306_008461 [Fusarium sp. DS 682]|nr:hypothetical protein IL306_008461 [Fusarium sp. DS 682]